MQGLRNRVEILEQNRMQEMEERQKEGVGKDMTGRIKKLEINMEGRERKKREEMK